MTLQYAFQASQTNRVTASTNLINWLLLGTEVSDANGIFEFLDVESKELDLRFYKVQPVAGP